MAQGAEAGRAQTAGSRARSSCCASRPSKCSTSARAVAREHAARYLVLPNYTNNLRKLGFDDADFAGSGTDRLIDAIVAWGDVDAIVGRVRAHHDAGADHVCVQVLVADPASFPRDEWRALAPALLDAP